eukprot:907630-Pleurochrysis_carterae.AAC.1
MRSLSNKLGSFPPFCARASSATARCRPPSHARLCLNGDTASVTAASPLTASSTRTSARSRRAASRCACRCASRCSSARSARSASDAVSDRTAPPNALPASSLAASHGRGCADTATTGTDAAAPNPAVTTLARAVSARASPFAAVCVPLLPCARCRLRVLCTTVRRDGWLERRARRMALTLLAGAWRRGSGSVNRRRPGALSLRCLPARNGDVGLGEDPAPRDAEDMEGVGAAA